MSLDINKQSMKYSQYGEKVTIYQRDDNGDILYYTTSEGEKIPLEDRTEIGYSKPVSFRANISNKLSEALMKEFGIDDSTNYCQIVTDKGYLPLKTGDLIWKKSAVGYDDENNVDKTSADYVVKGVADEGLTVDLYLLQKNVR